MFEGRKESGSKLGTFLIFHEVQSSPGFVKIGKKIIHLQDLWLNEAEAKSSIAMVSIFSKVWNYYGDMYGEG